MSLPLIGHGRAGRLVWDGFSGYPLLQTEGMGYSRIVGLDFDGGGGRRSRIRENPGIPGQFPNSPVATRAKNIPSSRYS